MADDNKNTTNKVDGTQNNVTGNQYNAETINIGVDGQPFNPAASLAAYLRNVREANTYIDPRGIRQTQRQVQLRMDAVYSPLSAVREISAADSDRRIEMELRRIEERTDLPAEEREQLLDALTLRRVVASPAAPERLEAIVRQQQRVVFLGDPGAGKTTALRYLVYRHAIALQNGEPEVDGLPTRLPIYLRIAEFAEAHGGNKSLSISEWLPRYYKQHECHANHLDKLFEHWLEQGNALVLLDGLDEITEPTERGRIARGIQELVSAYPANRFVVTSRIAGYRAAPLAADFAEYTIAEMSRDDIATFLRQWCYAVERAETPDIDPAPAAEREISEILDAVDHNEGVKQLASNPLLLTIIALIHRTGARLPDRRVELYHLAVTSLIRRWQENPDPNVKSFLLDETEVVRVLGPLAYCMHANRPSGLVTYGEVKRFIGQILAERNDLDPEDHAIERQVTDFLTRVRESTGLFVERAPKRYGFMHLTFEEYFTARYITQQKPARRANLIRRHLHDPRWQEPILLALAYLGIDYPDEAEFLLLTAILRRGEEAANLPPRPTDEYEDLFHADLLFAVRALGDGVPVRKKVMEGLVDEMLGIYFAKNLTLLYFDAGQGIYKLLQEQIGNVLHSVGGSNVGEYALTQIMIKLDDEHIFVRVSAIDALKYLGVTKPNVTSKLLSALKDEDSNIRRGAVDALSQLMVADTNVVDALLYCLEDDNWHVRRAAVMALGHMKATDVRIVEKLFARLGDKDSDVRIAAADVFEQLNAVNSKVINSLLKRLEENPEYVRRNAVEALGRLGTGRSSRKIYNSILTLVDDNDRRMREKAINALAQLGVSSKAALAKLVSRLNDESGTVRGAAVSAMANLEVVSKQVIDLLLDKLEDEDWTVRYRSAEVLGELASESDEIVNALVSRLNHNSNDVRSLAVSALSQSKQSSDIVVASLLNRLHDESRLVRNQAASALGWLEISADEIVAGLQVLLNDEDMDVRGRAAAALAWLGKANEAAIAILIDQLKDDVMYMPILATEALGRLRITSAAVMQALSELARVAIDSPSSTYSSSYNSAYEALYTLVIAQCRTEGDEATCAMLKPRPADG